MKNNRQASQGGSTKAVKLQVGSHGWTELPKVQMCQSFRENVEKWCVANGWPVGDFIAYAMRQLLVKDSVKCPPVVFPADGPVKITLSPEVFIGETFARFRRSDLGSN